MRGSDWLGLGEAKCDSAVGAPGKVVLLTRLGLSLASRRAEVTVTRLASARSAQAAVTRAMALGLSGAVSLITGLRSLLARDGPPAQRSIAFWEGRYANALRVEALGVKGVTTITGILH